MVVITSVLLTLLIRKQCSTPPHPSFRYQCERGKTQKGNLMNIYIILANIYLEEQIKTQVASRTVAMVTYGETRVSFTFLYVYVLFT